MPSVELRQLTVHFTPLPSVLWRWSRGFALAARFAVPDLALRYCRRRGSSHKRWVHRAYGAPSFARTQRHYHAGRARG